MLRTDLFPIDGVLQMSAEAMKLALEKIARVNACDYEYQAWAREALNHCEDNLHMVKQEQGEPLAIKHRHEWFRTGEMKAGQMRCISCGTWGQEDMPQQRPSRSDMTWIGLTAEDIDFQAKKDDHAAYFALGALWAEAVLKEKNT